jgi:arylsulfatase A-like enzyme/tetratricopeptide (TPR) repeat protein
MIRRPVSSMHLRARPSGSHILDNLRLGFFPIVLMACTDAAVSDSPQVLGPTVTPDARPTLVLVTMDTTRADRLGIYGHEKAQTPALDALAMDGTRFERAYATVPLTIPSHASMLTSLYPPRHGVHNNGDAILPEAATTLAEILQAEGYQTAAAVSAFVTTRAWNLDQGFDAYFDDLSTPEQGQGQGRWAAERRADSVVDDLEEWLQTVDSSQPAFLWAHFYDPHDPYAPPESMRADFARRPYDGEIAFMDSQIGRLQKHVEARYGDNIAWILVADHGEAIHGEHGEKTHGLYLFDPTMRIPFILRPAKGQESPVVVTDRAVSNVDVMTTGLGLVGIEPPEGLDGIDLSPFTRGETPDRAPVYLESENVTQRFGFAPEIAIVDEQWKLMDTPNPLLFDTSTDPGEQQNVLDSHPDQVSLMRETRVAVQSAPPIADTADVAPELMQQLEALGYTSHDVQDTSARGDEDAKDHRQIVHDLEIALRLVSEGGDPVQAEERYRAILEKYESLGEARLGLARALNAQERRAEAEQVLREAIEIQPQSTVLRSNLANTLAAQGKHDEGLALMETILDQVPEDDLARMGILKMLTDLNRVDEAISKAEGWLKKDPEHHGLRAHLGVALHRAGRLDEAVPHLEASLLDEVPRQLVRRILALHLMQSNRLDEATVHLEKETSSFPRGAEAHRELSGLYLRAKRLDESFEQLKLAEEHGKMQLKMMRLGLIQAFFNQKNYDAAREALSPLLQTSDEDPIVLKWHAELLLKEGKPEEAKAVFERAQAALRSRQKR